MFDIIRPGRTALETGGQLQHTLVFFKLRVKRFNIYTILQFNELFSAEIASKVFRDVYKIKM